MHVHLAIIDHREYYREAFIVCMYVKPAVKPQDN